MIGGLYYQNQIFESEIARYDSVVKEKQEYINKIVDAERDRMIAREQYLMNQRDEFINLLKENQKWWKAFCLGRCSLPSQ